MLRDATRAKVFCSSLLRLPFKSSLPIASSERTAPALTGWDDKRSASHDQGATRCDDQFAQERNCPNRRGDQWPLCSMRREDFGRASEGPALRGNLCRLRREVRVSVLLVIPSCPCASVRSRSSFANVSGLPCATDSYGDFAKENTNGLQTIVFSGGGAGKDHARSCCACRCGQSDAGTEIQMLLIGKKWGPLRGSSIRPTSFVSAWRMQAKRPITIDQVADHMHSLFFNS